MGLHPVDDPSDVFLNVPATPTSRRRRADASKGKALSNAMRSSKSILAGLAAGALGAGLLVGAMASPANAASVAATTSPVRVTYAATTLEQVPYASIAWTASTALATGDSAVVTLTQAPTPTAKLGIQTGESVGTPAAYSAGAFSAGTNVSLTTNAQSLAAYYDTGNGATAALMAVAADTPGTYVGEIQAFRSGVATGDPAAFSFTTVGLPTSLSLTPATQTVAAGGTASMIAELKTATGALTQPTCVDTVTTAASPSTAGSPQAITMCTNGAANSMFDGKATFTYSPSAAGSFSISATPGGTLPSTGVTAQSVVVNSLSTIAPDAAVVAAPAVGISQGSQTVYTEPTALVTTGGSQTATLYAATSVKDITFAVSGATAGAQVAYTVTDSSVTPAGVTNTASTVTLGADKTGTFTVSAAAPFATAPATGSTYTVVIGVGGGNQATYTVQYGTTNVINVGNVTLSPAASTTNFVKTGEATSVKATVTNQFGLPLSGVVVASTPSASTGTTGTTGAEGNATLAVAAPTSSSVTTQTVTFTANYAGVTSSATSAVTFIYNASGAPTSLTLATTAGNAAASALATQYVDTPGTATGVWASTTGNEAKWMAVTATVGGASSGVPVTFSGTDVYFNAGSASNLNASSTEKGKITEATSGGAVTVYAKATKTGLATITATAGTISTTITWQVANQSTDARVITVTPAVQESGSPAQVKATVTDAFGNGVANAALNFSEEGVGNFATGTSTLTTSTGPNGSVVVDVISTQSGDSTVTVIAGATANYAGAADSPVAGAPKGVSSGVGAIKFGAGSKSITITGSRTTVSGKPGIKIDGAVTGIDNGKTVVPYFRFPGETTFSQGSARPVISGGKFTWERKTGKKFYAYVTSDDGAVKSNRVIIAAN